MSKPPYYRPAFDIFAPLYDLGVWIIGLPLGGERKLRRLILEAITGADLKSLTGCRILELCCGTATLSIMAAGYDTEVYGLDLSPGMLRVAREKSQRENISLRLVQADAVSIPFKKMTFNSVVSSMGLHEMPLDAIRNIFKETKRVLKNDGRFIIFDYHKGKGFSGLLQNIFFIFAEHDEAKEFIRADLQKELREAGFKRFQRKFLAGGTLQIVTVNA